jgi:hypothetical protein
MLFRPFLLDDFEQQRYLDANGHDLNQQSKENVRYCLKAAISITETIHEMSQRPDKMRTSWVTSHTSGRTKKLTGLVCALLRLSSCGSSLCICDQKCPNR